MSTKPYPSYSSLSTTNHSPVDNPLPPGSHTSTPPLQPHQRRQVRRSQRMASSNMFPPVPSSPSSPPLSVVRRRQSSVINPDHYHHHPAHNVPHSPPPSTTPTTVSSLNEGAPYRESLSVEPLSLSRPRPDSTILPGSWPQDGSGRSDSDSNPSSLLDPRYFTAVVQRGEVIQYWLPVELVTQGLPGRSCVPKGHWERLTELAEDVRISTTASERGNVQLVTGWCHIQELGMGGEPVNDETAEDYKAYY